MKQQTAVEWLINEIDHQFPEINIRRKEMIIDRAKAMEKEQIMDAFNNGENKSAEIYYNEKYNNGNTNL